MSFLGESFDMLQPVFRWYAGYQDHPMLIKLVWPLAITPHPLNSLPAELRLIGKFLLVCILTIWRYSTKREGRDPPDFWGNMRGSWCQDFLLLPAGLAWTTYHTIQSYRPMWVSCMVPKGILTSCLVPPTSGPSSCYAKGTDERSTYTGKLPVVVDFCWDIMLMHPVHPHTFSWTFHHDMAKLTIFVVNYRACIRWHGCGCGCAMILSLMQLRHSFALISIVLISSFKAADERSELFSLVLATLLPSLMHYILLCFQQIRAGRKVCSDPERSRSPRLCDHRLPLEV